GGRAAAGGAGDDRRPAAAAAHVHPAPRAEGRLRAGAAALEGAAVRRLFGRARLPRPVPPAARGPGRGRAGSRRSGGAGAGGVPPAGLAPVLSPVARAARYDGTGWAASSAASAAGRSGDRDREPAASRRRGITRALASMSLLTPPIASLSARSGRNSSPGRWTAAARADLNSALVTGCGVFRFTGPVISGCASRKLTIAAWSAGVVKLITWGPAP